MGLVTIGKEFTFHAAHQLPHHDGQCRNLHGHTYTLEVSVTGVVRPPNGAAEEGMVLDFSRLKAIYKEAIEPHVEHRHLNETLDGKVPGTELDLGSPVSRYEPLTTCEHIATWIHHEFKERLEIPERSTGHLRSLSVKLWETPTSWAKVGKDWRE